VLAQNVELDAVGPPIFVGFSAASRSQGALAGEWALARALSMIHNRVDLNVSTYDENPKPSTLFDFFHLHSIGFNYQITSGGILVAVAPTARTFSA
jgi:hypothetical protein